MTTNPQILATGLPDSQQPKMEFLESSFFKGNRSNVCLPTPAEVRALSGRTSTSRELPTRFKHLNLIVKWGPDVTVSEAQSLWAIKMVLGNEVPMPELCGCQVDGHDVFIYMEYVHGETLAARWDSLTNADKTSVCDHLKQIISSCAALSKT